VPEAGWIRTLAGAASLLLLLAGAPATSQPKPKPAPKPVIRFHVSVVYVSPEPGEIDPRGRDLHRSLAPQFRYESMQVLDDRELELRIDQVGRVELPNGRDLRLRPLDVDSRGVLIAVDVERQAKMDLRVKPGHKAVIGAHPYREGKLVISIEPEL
jgi:hypothetical protein